VVNSRIGIRPRQSVGRGLSVRRGDQSPSETRHAISAAAAKAIGNTVASMAAFSPLPVRSESIADKA
jgi:hypothetical protein